MLFESTTFVDFLLIFLGYFRTYSLVVAACIKFRRMSM